MEIATEIARRQLLAAFAMNDVREARDYLDSLAILYPVLSKVVIADVLERGVRGSWVVPRVTNSPVTILYLHGGGYSFYPRSFYDNLAAMIAVSAGCRLFSLDYRLSPEYQFPAQLDDAKNAYQWLVNEGNNPAQLVVAGDSAGGNLAMALLLSLRESTLPLPALAVCLSPATNFEDSQNSTATAATQARDWITREMALRWATWYCSPSEARNPLVSPVYADLRGLPPIYIQAGGSEILFANIEEFVERAREQGADIAFDVWPAMNHDFAGFGYDVPQSAEAIERVGSVIASRIPRTKLQPSAT